MMYRDLSGEKTVAAGQLNREREYWLDKLSGKPVKSSFPPDRLVPGGQEKKPALLSFKWPESLYQRLKTVSGGSASRLHMLLVTGLTLLLYKYTGHTDIIIATPIDKQEFEGEFINTVLTLRSPIDEHMTVKDFLLRVKQTIIQANEHQNYPIDTLPYDLGLPMVEGEFPLFDTALLLENIQDKAYLRNIGLDLVFSFLDSGDSLQGTIEYNAARYEEGTMQRINRHYLHLVREAFNRVELKLVEVPVLTGEEREWLVEELNRTHSDYPRDMTIHRLFEQQVQKTPGNGAVEERGNCLTYSRLNEKANGLARYLRKNGIGAGDVVAIRLGSCLAVPLAIMAVLKAGATYLPMGFEYPPERSAYLLKDSQARMLLTTQPADTAVNPDFPTLYLEEETLYAGPQDNLEHPADPTALVYIIYTSGTTGQPKGVMVEHRGLVNYTCWAARTYVKEERVDFPLYTSISFDLTVTSIFTPLVAGSAIIVYGGTAKTFYIQEVIADNRVGAVKLTPSHLELILANPPKNSGIKRLIVGGEELETRLIAEIYRNFGEKIEIYNEYGPTETVVGSMIYRCDPAVDHRHSVPIGQPIANTQVYLLDRHLQPVPLGAVGQLYISGDGLARGYLHNPRMSEEKFVPNPFIPDRKMYQTGDLALRLANGMMEYKGRIDHQVKIRGYRVETGEIEAKILQFQGIAHSLREQKEQVVEKLDLKSIPRCKTCLIPVNYPGGTGFDENGVCDICRQFQTYQDNAFAYFKTPAEFFRRVEQAQQTRKSQYDCLMLYSGGKDSSYVLHRLVEKGLKVLAFTFDNGYISSACWENIARTTSLLQVDHVVKDTEAMKEIFVESLWSDYNVCNGCFKAVNTLGTQLAHDHRINLVISGLTRGQIFDIKLHGLFKLGVFDDEAIENRLALFRQNYHAMTHRTSRLIGVEITAPMLENLHFVDYFRYDAVSTAEILAYLKERDPGWERPLDTGSSSSNCIINDVGIYVHLKDKGCHFYSAQLSWDCRLGTLSLEEGLEEITGYKANYPQAYQVLKEIGYYNAFSGAVVAAVKDEKGENALCAYILADKEFDIPGLRDYLSRELPEYMIPLYFVKIDQIPLTSSGKVDRSALPKPGPSLSGEPAPPRDALEKKIADVWAEVLGLKAGSLGIDVNFFEVGGHSLRATFLAAALQKEFNVRVPLVKIFEKPFIRGLAEYIREEAREERFESIPPLEKREYYTLSSPQKRLYVFQQLNPRSIAYNINVFVRLVGVDRQRLKEVLTRLLQRHESLRTSIENIRDNPVQRLHPTAPLEISDFHLSAGGTGSEEEVETVINNFIRPFQLNRAPLLRVGLLSLTADEHLLMVDLHHIVTDMISQQILVRDFTSLYNGRSLPPLKIQYRDYSQWQAAQAAQPPFQSQQTYWLQKFASPPPSADLPTDFSRPGLQDFAGDTVPFILPAEQAAALKRIALEQGMTLFMVIVAIYATLLYKITQQEDIAIGTPIAGRRHPDLEPVMGMFVNTLVLRCYPRANLTFAAFLEEIKREVLDTFENQDYPFDELVENVVAARDTGRNPLFDVIFDFHGSNRQEELPQKKIEDLKPQPYKPGNIQSKFDMMLGAEENGKELLFSIVYCKKLFKKATIQRFSSFFQEIAAAVVQDSDMKLEDLKISHHLVDIEVSTFEEDRGNFEF